MSLLAAIFYTIFLIVWGSLLITACAKTFQLTNQLEPTLTADQKSLYHWSRFGAVMVGISGAAVILAGFAAIVDAASGGGSNK